MKFRDPETGEILNGAIDMAEHYCQKFSDCCVGCQIKGHPGHLSCVDWVVDNPVTAANRMGYEVIEDAIPEKKPLRDMTVGEWKALCDKRTRELHEDGKLGAECDGCDMAEICAIPPDEWDLTEKPHLTVEEAERCRVYGAKWIYRTTGGDQPIFLSREKMVLDDTDCPSNTDDCGFIVSVWDTSLFPSVKPGIQICVEEAIIVE